MCESIKLILNYIFVLVTIVFKCILKCSIYNLFSLKKHLGIDEKKTEQLGILLDLQPSCNNCSFCHSTKSSK